jgi:hypothetical protein
LTKKSKKKSAKKKISAREFNKDFTRIIAGHLVTLPAEEQDRRIRSAHRVVVSRFRGASSTKRGADETRQTPLAARTRHFGNHAAACERERFFRLFLPPRHLFCLDVSQILVFVVRHYAVPSSTSFLSLRRMTSELARSVGLHILALKFRFAHTYRRQIEGATQCNSCVVGKPPRKALIGIRVYSGQDWNCHSPQSLVNDCKNPETSFICPVHRIMQFP